jgi:hypothetical protein
MLISSVHYLFLNVRWNSHVEHLPGCQHLWSCSFHDLALNVRHPDLPNLEESLRDKLHSLRIPEVSGFRKLNLASLNLMFCVFLKVPIASFSFFRVPNLGCCFENEPLHHHLQKLPGQKSVIPVFEDPPSAYVNLGASIPFWHITIGLCFL